MDINQRLNSLLKARGWSQYRLAKNCGLSESTLQNIFHRNTCPSFTTLDAICTGFGITLAQFFAEGDMVELSPQLKELFDNWLSLTPEQKDAALAMIKAMNHSND